MARIEIPEGDGMAVRRVWEQVPHMAKAIHAMSKAVYEESSLPIREREVARMRIAQLNQCDIWQHTRAASAMQQGLDDDLYNAVARYYDNDDFTPREKLAIEYAEQFAIDPSQVSDAFIGRMREVFSDVEILELTATNAFCLGFGRALTALDVKRDFDVLWSREPAAPS